LLPIVSKKCEKKAAQCARPSYQINQPSCDNPQGSSIFNHVIEKSFECTLWTQLLVLGHTNAQKNPLFSKERA